MQFFNRKRAMQSDASNRAGAGRPQGRLGVLLVDENPTAREVVARRLSHLGYDVVLAEDGFRALSLLQTRPVDIILIDMGMILLPAVATMDRIRAAKLDARACILMIADGLDARSTVAALEAGADDLIVKPFDFDVLDARMRHLCQRAEQMNLLARHNAELDARIARRAVELGETRDALTEMQADRARLVSSIQALHDEIARLQSAQA